MLFWVLTGVTALVFVVTFLLNVFAFYNRFWGSLGYALLVTVLTTLVLGFVNVIASSAGANHDVKLSFVEEHTESIVALGTDSSLKGRSYFLGGGHLGSQRVFNYMTKDKDGFVRLATAPAQGSAVKEDAEPGTARVIVRTVEKRQDWLSPFSGGHWLNYEFHVPAGSVVESYTVDNK